MGATVGRAEHGLGGLRWWAVGLALVGFWLANYPTTFLFRDDPTINAWLTWPLFRRRWFFLWPLALVVAIKLWSVAPRRWRLGKDTSTWLLLTVLAAMAAFTFRIGPGWTATSDRHDAIIGGFRMLWEGHNPYHYRTFLDNTVSPMVGGLLLAGPFILLQGSLALQGLAWLWIVAWGLWRYVGPQASLLVMTLFCLGPALRLELAISSDGWINAANLIVFGSAAWHLSRHVGRRRSWGFVAFVGACVLFGLAIAYRMNYGVAAFPVVIGLWRAHGLRRAAWTAAIAAPVSLVVALGPWLANRAIYAPFEKASMGLSPFYPNWPTWIGVATLATIAVGTWFARSLRGVWLTSAAAMTVFILMVCIGRHAWNFYEPWSYSSAALLYLLVGLVLPGRRRDQSSTT